MKVNTLKDLRKLNVGPPIEIQRAGSHFKARWRGRANCVFAPSAEEAAQRLRNSDTFRFDHPKFFKNGFTKIGY